MLSWIVTKYWLQKMSHCVEVRFFFILLFLPCVFQHIANGNESEVKRLLSEGESDEEVKKMCHPLCSCDLCDLQLSGSALA